MYPPPLDSYKLVAILMLLVGFGMVILLLKLFYGG